MLAICIATGPSLTPEDVLYCRGRGRVYAVKEAATLAPWADVLYAADPDWWDYKEGYTQFAGERWTCNESAAHRYGLEHITVDTDAPWCEGEKIASGGHSGFQAINLAYLHGATKIVLLGYDMGFTGTLKHWYDNTPGLKRTSRASNYKQWLIRMRQAAPLIPIPVINASRVTAIDCFPRQSLEKALHADDL